MLVCASCRRTVAFDPEGWVHRDPTGRVTRRPKDCDALVVTWPTPKDPDTDADNDDGDETYAA
jgi:hypothetical protein